MMTSTSSKHQSAKPQRAAIAAAATVAAAALLAGCTLAPTYERPAAPVAAQWPAAQPAA